MAEYRVTALHYRFKSDVEHDKFDDALPRTGTLGHWDYTVESGLLKAVPGTEFRDRRRARDDLELHLRDWEQSAFLAEPRYRISFEYDRSDVEDVDPRPGAVNVFPDTLTVKLTAFPPTIIRGHRDYPEPDTTFRHTPLTDRLTERLRRVQDNEAELPAVAYFVLDSVEHEFGRPGSRIRMREKAAATLNVDVAVLRKLGELTARPDPDIGRKSGGQPLPLTVAELTWIDAALFRVVRRVGEFAGGTALSRITMADLPPYA